MNLDHYVVEASSYFKGYSKEEYVSKSLLISILL